MRARDFAFWLQGYFEIVTEGDQKAPLSLTVNQVDQIRRHLNLVFLHEIDPSMGGPEIQKQLNDIHSAALARPVGPNQEPTAEVKISPELMVLIDSLMKVI